MARHAGISASLVQRIGSGDDIKLHRVKTFKLSNDPGFEGSAPIEVGSQPLRALPGRN